MITFLILKLSRSLFREIENQQKQHTKELQMLTEQFKQFAARQAAHNKAIADGVDNIAKDVKGLQATIDKLKALPGETTPEEQALLDQLDEQGSALETSVSKVDDLTPPEAPTA